MNRGFEIAALPAAGIELARLVNSEPIASLIRAAAAAKVDPPFTLPPIPGAWMEGAESTPPFLAQARALQTAVEASGLQRVVDQAARLAAALAPPEGGEWPPAPGVEARRMRDKAGGTK